MYCDIRFLLEPFIFFCHCIFGGLILGFEALWSFVPDVLIDSVGHPFVPPLFSFAANCKTASYVHYPTISTDMLALVRERRQNYNNRQWISKNYLFSTLKLLYYRIFTLVYGWSGRANNIIMVNSTWTYRHIIELWGKPQSTLIVYPPCDIDSLKKLSNKSEILLQENNQVRILSVGQFRPEKEHKMQLEILSLLLQKSNEEKRISGKCLNFKLVLIGGCRHKEDESRVEDLKKFANELGIEDHVDWKVNISFEELKSALEMALIGLHTMKNEHFGMAVVENMAAGLITVANNSAGPKFDIIKFDETEFEKLVTDDNLLTTQQAKMSGFLAQTHDQYVDAIWKITQMSREKRQAIRAEARRFCERFSDQAFKQAFLDAVRILL